MLLKASHGCTHTRTYAGRCSSLGTAWSVDPLFGHHADQTSPKDADMTKPAPLRYSDWQIEVVIVSADHLPR